MELEHIEEMANEFLEEFGLVRKGWTFKFANAKRRLGQCDYRKKLISFSKPYKDIDYKDIKDTILHEIAHALDKVRNGISSGHGSEWKRICMEIGCNPKSTTNIDTSHIEHKYDVVCKNHGTVGHMNRWNGRSGYLCAKCKEKVKIIQNY